MEQLTIKLWSIEAKYKGVVVVACEVVWLKRILKDLGDSINDPVLIYYDNLNSIHLARNAIFHARTKHIEVHYHFIRDRVLGGTSTFNISSRLFRQPTSS